MTTAVPIPKSRECACGCGKPAPLAKITSRKRGWVKGEPTRFRHGHGGGRKSVPMVERFWHLVDQRGPDECWPWTGWRCEGGYGVISERKTSEYTHRLAYELTNGTIPSGEVVRHVCDNPPCCNPRHLLLGSPAENSQDAVTRDRTAYGERAPQARLTESEIPLIHQLRSEGMAQEAIAARLGVGRGAVRGVLEGRTWVRSQPSR